MAEGKAARRLALDVVSAVTRKQLPLDESFDGHPALGALETRDRAFARHLSTTTLRRLGQVDGLIDFCVEKPLPDKAVTVKDILRIGMTQILFLRTPPHAAVDTAVDLTRESGNEHYAKLVNAVLRRIVRGRDNLLAGQDPARMNTPDWLWHSWVAAYGEETARAIAEAHLGEPPLDFSVKTDPETWAERLEAAVLPTGTVRRSETASVPGLPGYDEGAWWVQDAAAALPARLLGDVRGQRVIDMCAAPGGKTAQLAAGGAEVTAVDRSANRLKRLSENLTRLGLNARTVTADAGVWTPEAPADAVLLDAPCTATGTLRRHPDVARLKSANDIPKVAALQKRLAIAALSMVRPGGLVVFCTCSLQQEEGPAHFTAPLDGAPPHERVPVTPDEIGGLDQCVATDGSLRTLPFHMG
ncbi:MAG: MFS transporter, partial [Rhodospirillales bacterium]|nr:MFS transporter [Rhodospirillales bacterium]